MPNSLFEFDHIPNQCRFPIANLHCPLLRNILQCRIRRLHERYAQGMLDRISFSACVDNNYIGMITLEFPYSNNANIYWMAVAKSYHGRHVGKKLLHAAENYCNERRCFSLTVATLTCHIPKIYNL